MIQIKNISKKFKTELIGQPFLALDKVSFSIPENQVVGFLGANGAGKTTLIKIIMGFIFADEGEVKFNSKLGSNKFEVLRNIGYLPERPYYYPSLTGAEFVNYLGELNKLDKFTLQKRVKSLSEQFKIDFALKRKIRTYSKGMLQRLGFVATLVHDPQVIIYDEPLSGLDPVGRKELKNSLIELSGLKKTIFFSTHVISDVEEICQYAVCLNNGKLLFEGTVQSLLEKHMGESFELKYIKDQVLVTQVINARNKSSELKKLTEGGYEIVSLIQEKQNLENIIYSYQDKN